MRIYFGLGIGSNECLHASEESGGAGWDDAGGVDFWNLFQIQLWKMATLNGEVLTITHTGRKHTSLMIPNH